MSTISASSTPSKLNTFNPLTVVVSVLGPFELLCNGVNATVPERLFQLTTRFSIKPLVGSVYLSIVDVSLASNQISTSVICDAFHVVCPLVGVGEGVTVKVGVGVGVNVGVGVTVKVGVGVGVGVVVGVTVKVGVGVGEYVGVGVTV